MRSNFLRKRLFLSGIDDAMESDMRNSQLDLKKIIFVIIDLSNEFLCSSKFIEK